jgi:hypothetical protein
MGQCLKTNDEAAIRYDLYFAVIIHSSAFTFETAANLLTQAALAERNARMDVSDGGEASGTPLAKRHKRSVSEARWLPRLMRLATAVVPKRNV